MNNLSIIIIYKNNSYKIISFKKLHIKQLMKNSIKFILIPLYDNINAYIPIKPTTLYNFNKAIVSIIYQPFVYDEENTIGTSFDIQEFKSECNNIIDFINALYNVYKFRGTGIFLDDNNKMAIPVSFVMTLRKVNIKFYDSVGNIIDEIDSGVMKDLSELKPKRFQQTPPAYICEDRLESLKEILFIPTIFNYNGRVDLEKLPLCIRLNSDNTWNKIKKPGKDLKLSDHILCKIRDYEIYYLIDYEIYKELIKSSPFQISFISTPVAKEYDENILPSLDENKIPSQLEKRRVINRYIDNDIFSICDISVSIYTIDDFLQSYVFFNTILSYIKYFAIFCYQGEDNDIIMKTFAIFERIVSDKNTNDTDLITDLESTPENITNAFIKIMQRNG